MVDRKARIEYETVCTPQQKGEHGMPQPHHTFRCPPVIQAGQGAAAETGPLVKRLGVSGILLVTDNVLLSSGTLAPVIASLEGSGIRADIYAGADSAPALDHIEECLARLEATPGLCAILGCGDAGPLAVAKAVSVTAANNRRLQDFMRQITRLHPLPPFVAVPATIEAGSEATLCTLVTDVAADVQKASGTPRFMPDLAIVDPALTIKQPQHVTAAAGVNALTHAIEAYVSRKAHPLSDWAAREAIRLLFQNLSTACDEPGNVKALSDTMLGSLLAGVALSGASDALVRGMSRPVSAHFSIPHGVSSAALLGEVTEFSLPGNYARYADAAKLMGIESKGSDKAAAEAGAAALRELMAHLKIPGLKQLGVTREMLDPAVEKMADDALASGSPDNNPRLASKAEVIELYYRSL